MLSRRSKRSRKKRGIDARIRVVLTESSFAVWLSQNVSSGLHRLSVSPCYCLFSFLHSEFIPSVGPCIPSQCIVSGELLFSSLVTYQKIVDRSSPELWYLWCVSVSWRSLELIRVASFSLFSPPRTMSTASSRWSLDTARRQSTGAVAQSEAPNLSRSGAGASRAVPMPGRMRE